MCSTRCLTIIFSLLASLICVVMVLLSYSKDMYTLKSPYVNMKTLIEVKTQNISQYIAHVLRKITDPKKKKEEETLFNEYMKQRDKYVRMLPRLTKQTLGTNFHILVDKVTKKVGRKYDMIVMVSSYSMHWDRRRNIRRLWGNITTSLNKNWRVVFITGGVNSEGDMKKLYDEAVKERDIVIEDFSESWSLNMGRKVMAGLQWVNANLNFDYVLKTDDDVFADVDGILAKLKTIKEKYVYTGNIMVGSEVLRSGRYGVPVEEYPASVYEPYCSGGGYVLSGNLIGKMVPLFQWEHPLRIDDAYIGGRVIKAGGQARHDGGFLMWNDKCSYEKDLLLTHPAGAECMEKLQNIVLEKKKKYLDLQN